jgi:L-ribulokinase
MFGAVSAGKEVSGFENIEQAQKIMTGTTKVYEPYDKNHLEYKNLYDIYKKLHDGFGTKEWNGNMYNIMKDLLDIRDKVRREK